MRRRTGSKAVPAGTRAATAVFIISTLTNSSIASLLKLPGSTVATIAARVRCEGTAGSRRHRGRPRLLSARDARMSQLLVYRHLSWSLARLTQDFNQSVALRLSESTVCPYPLRACLRSCAAATKLLLTPRNVSLRRK